MHLFKVRVKLTIIIAKQVVGMELNFSAYFR